MSGLHPIEERKVTARLTQMANEVSAAIEEAVEEGIPMDEAVSVAACVIADHGRMTYGETYLVSLAELVRRCEKFERGDPFYHVLYVDLPTGQVSFHTDFRCEGPDYAGAWDGIRGVQVNRVLRFVSRVLGDTTAEAA